MVDTLIKFHLALEKQISDWENVFGGWVYLNWETQHGTHHSTLIGVFENEHCSIVRVYLQL